MGFPRPLSRLCHVVREGACEGEIISIWLPLAKHLSNNGYPNMNQMKQAMQSISVENAIGMMLWHDMTRIVPGESKGPEFRKGHIVREEDIPLLLEMGKEHVYVMELTPDILHEDQAARRLANAAAGSGITLSQPCEGRVNLVASHDGLLKIDTRTLGELNALENIMFATLHTNQRVAAGTTVAGTRVIPLAIPEEQVAEAENLCRQRPLVEVKVFQPHRVGLIVTGSEIFHGRIKDAFSPIVEKKFNQLGSVVIGRRYTSDDKDKTVAAIHELVEAGAECIALTGGMSVDPDDQTPGSIRASGAEVITYGVPILPGAMFMLAYLGDTPVIGLPGCVMYYKASIFDLVVPRLMTGERLKRSDFVNLGHGGLCMGCEVCRYPHCSFGKA